MMVGFSLQICRPRFFKNLLKNDQNSTRKKNQNITTKNRKKMTKKKKEEEITYHTISDLIKKLQEYPSDTPICSGYIEDGFWNHFDLVVKESNPIGSRDVEDDLLLWIGPIEQEEIETMSPKEMWDILNQRPDEEHDSGEFHSPEL